MGLNRRDFLQRAGLTLFSLGAIDRLFLAQINREAVALSAFEGRKLALLIGINRYQNVPELKGCVQDLEIQKQLLVHRFGFSPDNILTLKDQEASRENIITAFQKQLKETVQPGDFIFVHFSGYGAKVPGNDGDPSIAAIVPVDGVITSKNASVNNLIAVATLEQLIRSLNAAQNLLLLDTGFEPSKKPTSLYWQSRTYPKAFETTLNPSELALQEQLQVNLSQRSLARNVVPTMAAAEVSRGVEIQWHGASAGLLTTLLAQYLWAIAPNGTPEAVRDFLQVCYAQFQLRANLLPVTTKAARPFYVVMANSPQVAVGSVISQDGKSFNVCLGGLSLDILQAIATGSIFYSVNDPKIKLQLTNQSGLFGKVKALNPELLPKVGHLLRESQRILPRHLNLKVALSNNLSRIEKVDATSAFANVLEVATMVSVPEYADYVYGTGYQLFSAAGQRIQTLMVAEANETVKSAVIHLKPRFEQLLAVKWLNLLSNETSTKLSVAIALSRQGKSVLRLAEKSFPAEQGNGDAFKMLKVTFQDKLQYEFTNQGDQELYVVGFAVSPYQELYLLTPTDVLQLPPAAQSIVPKLMLEPLRPVGYWEIQWVCSSQPLQRIQEFLDKLPHNEADPLKLEQPLSLIRTLLLDLHDVTDSSSENDQEFYHLSTDKWASVGFYYEVTEMQ